MTVEEYVIIVKEVIHALVVVAKSARQVQGHVVVHVRTKHAKRVQMDAEIYVKHVPERMRVSVQLWRLAIHRQISVN